jgi:hypothetical protein
MVREIMTADFMAGSLRPTGEAVKTVFGFIPL